MTCICEWSGRIGRVVRCEFCDCGGEMPCDGCADCEWADEWDAMGLDEEEVSL